MGGQNGTWHGRGCPSAPSARRACFAKVRKKSLVAPPTLLNAEVYLRNYLHPAKPAVLASGHHLREAEQLLHHKKQSTPSPFFDFSSKTPKHQNTHGEDTQPCKKPLQTPPFASSTTQSRASLSPRSQFDIEERTGSLRLALSQSRHRFAMSSLALSDKDVNKSMATAGNKPDLKSMDYHRQILASKMEAAQYEWPDDERCEHGRLLTVCKVNTVHLALGQHHEPLHREAERLPEQAGRQVRLLLPCFSFTQSATGPHTDAFPTQGQAQVTLRPGLG